MSLSPDTYQIQQRFAMYCRTGEPDSLPGAHSDRLQHYRSLIFNMVNDTMETAFPIAFGQLSRKKWDAMLYDFFSNHPCTAYQVWKLPAEFYQYALASGWAKKYRIPYLDELLLFEWTEMELYNMEDLSADPFFQKGDWMQDVLVLTPEHRLLTFDYPVHLTRDAKEIKSGKGRYYLLLFRHPETGNIEMIDLSAWFAWVIEQVSEGLTLTDILNYAISNGWAEYSVSLEEATVAFLKMLNERDFIRGFKQKIN